jgi:hypothetical protein
LRCYPPLNGATVVLAITNVAEFTGCAHWLRG